MLLNILQATIGLTFFFTLPFSLNYCYKLYILYKINNSNYYRKNYFKTRLEEQEQYYNLNSNNTPLTNTIFSKKKNSYNYHNSNTINHSSSSNDKFTSRITTTNNNEQKKINNMQKLFSMILNSKYINGITQALWLKIWLTASLSNLIHLQNFMILNTHFLNITETILIKTGHNNNNDDENENNFARTTFKCLQHVNEINIMYPHFKNNTLYDYLPFNNYYDNLVSLSIYLDTLYFNFDILPQSIINLKIDCFFNIDTLLIKNQYCILNCLPSKLQTLILKSEDCSEGLITYYSDDNEENNIFLNTSSINNINSNNSRKKNHHVYMHLFNLLPTSLVYFRLDTWMHLPKHLINMLPPTLVYNFFLYST